MDWITSMVDPPPMMPNLTVTTTPYPIDITTTTTISTTTPILLTTMAALLSNLTADEFQTVKVTENPLVFDEKDLAFTEFPDFTDYDWEPAYNAPLVSTRTTEEAPKLNNVVCKFPKDLLFDMPAVSHNYVSFTFFHLNFYFFLPIFVERVRLKFFPLFLSFVFSQETLKPPTTLRRVCGLLK